MSWRPSNQTEENESSIIYANITEWLNKEVLGQSSIFMLFILLD